MTNPETPTAEETAAALAAATALVASAAAKKEADDKLAADEKAAADKLAAESGEDESKLPEWARSKMTKANAEAAKYRTELRTAQEALSKAKSPEEFDALRVALEAKAADATKSALVEKVARKHKLPDELAELLKGETPEELEAHAKVLTKFVAGASAPGDLRGGLNPSDSGDSETDPRKLAARSKRR